MLWSILACAPAADLPSIDARADAKAVSFSWIEGSADAVGMAALLNDASTTLTVLDDAAALEKRAATKLITRRDGADAKYGTSDDNSYDSVAEIDGVAWVGSAALAAIHAYAEANGFVPEGDDTLGTWEGVAFTVNEADATLEYVNAATDAELDADLNRRAVDAILAARPLESVLALSNVYYVGGTALTALKTAAEVETYAELELPATTERADCDDTADCATGERCVGSPNDGSSDFGRCTTIAKVPGEGLACTADSDCAENLVCMGHLAYGGSGYCIEEWQADNFSNATDVSIPDAGSATSSVVVTGLATNPVDMQVLLDIDHPRLEDLLVTITMPAGSTGTLWANECAPETTVLVDNGVEADTYVNGRWTLTVTDTAAGESGTLHGWSIYLTSNWG